MTGSNRRPCACKAPAPPLRQSPVQKESSTTSFSPRAQSDLCPAFLSPIVAIQSLRYSGIAGRDEAVNQPGCSNVLIACGTPALGGLGQNLDLWQTASLPRVKILVCGSPSPATGRNLDLWQHAPPATGRNPGLWQTGLLPRVKILVCGSPSLATSRNFGLWQPAPLATGQNPGLWQTDPCHRSKSWFVAARVPATGRNPGLWQHSPCHEPESRSVAAAPLARGRNPGLWQHASPATNRNLDL